MNPRTNLRERDAIHDRENAEADSDAARTQHPVLEEGPVRVPRRSHRRELIPRPGWQGDSGGVGGFVVLLFATAFRGGRGLVRHIGVARVRLQGLASHGLLCVSLCLAVFFARVRGRPRLPSREQVGVGRYTVGRLFL